MKKSTPQRFIFLLLTLTIALANKPYTLVLIQSPDLQEKHVAAFENRFVSGLNKTDKFVLIERREIEAVVSELSLHQSGLIDDNTVQEVGHFVGAEQIIVGVITDIGDHFNVDCRIVAVETSEILNSVSVLAKPNIIELLNKISSIIMELIKTRDRTTVDKLKDMGIPFRSLHFSPDLYITLEPNKIVKVHSNQVTDIVNDGRNFFTCGVDGNVIAWELNTIEQNEKLFGYTKWNFSAATLAFDNEYYAAGADNGTVYIWRTDRWGNPFQLKEHKTKVTDIQFANNYRHLFSTDSRGNLLIWDYQYQKLTNRKRVFNSGIHSMLLNGDEKGLFLLADNGTLKLFDINRKEMASSVVTNRRPSAQMVINSEKNTIVCGFINGYVQVYRVSYNTESRLLNENWITPSIEFYKSIKLFDGDVTTLAFAPAGDILIAGSQDGKIKIVDSINWLERGAGQLGETAISAINFLSNDTFITGSLSGEVSSWSIE